MRKLTQSQLQEIVRLQQELSIVDQQLQDSDMGGANQLRQENRSLKSEIAMLRE